MWFRKGSVTYLKIEKPQNVTYWKNVKRQNVTLDLKADTHKRPTRLPAVETVRYALSDIRARRIHVPHQRTMTTRPFLSTKSRPSFQISRWSEGRPFTVRVHPERFPVVIESTNVSGTA